MTRERLSRIADLLAPEAADLPAASDIGTTGAWLDRVLVADPSLLEPLRALSSCDDWAALEAYGETDPATFELATFALIAAYCMHPRVRKRIGYPGQVPAPILADEFDYYLRDDLIHSVKTRGPSYVETPRG